jgi:hypothetical protein
MILESYKTDPLYLVERQMISSKRILAESCQGLSKEQTLIVEGIYNDLKPLIKLSLNEANLTADQIKQLFTNVEQQVTAGGENRSGLGQAKDVAVETKKIIGQIPGWLKNSTPVKNFDGKFKELKDTINKKFPDSKLLDAVSGLGTMAANNPGKTAAIVGILTVLAGLAAGPLGGMIAGSVLKSASQLLQGKDLSTAVGSGLKTGAMGAVAGFAGDAMAGGDAAADATAAGDAAGGLTIDPSAQAATDKLIGQYPPDEYTYTAGGAGNITITDADGNVVATQNISRTGLNGQQFVDYANQQGAKTESIVKKKQLIKEEILYNLRPLSESMVAILFKRIATTNHKMISEGVIWEQGDEPEGQKPSFMQKVMGKASEFGKNLTTKVTASKLMSAWKQEGSPPDSDGIAEFLKKQGVNDQVIAQTFKDMQLPPPGKGQATAEIADLKKEIAELGPESAKKLMGFLSQRLGAA